MLDSNDLCICKHPVYEHVRWHFGNKTPTKCAGYLVGGYWCRCLEFKLDNLKYLENEYQKTL
jgi:hypothetical protein